MEFIDLSADDGRQRLAQALARSTIGLVARLQWQHVHEGEFHELFVAADGRALLTSAQAGFLRDCGELPDGTIPGHVVAMTTLDGYRSDLVIAPPEEGDRLAALRRHVAGCDARVLMASALFYEQVRAARGGISM